jgi:outer membrane protein assembly factor BamB
LHGGKTNTVDPDNLGRVPIEVSSLDLSSGRTLLTHPAGLAHCFPPIASPRYIFAGVLDMTDLRTGEILANRITKAHCSTENGWVIANGLIYTTPKHCTCWPLLRGYVALAPARPGGEDPAKRPVESLVFPLEKKLPSPNAERRTSSDWPMYRHDAWRSGGTAAAGPRGLNVIWSTRLAGEADVAPPAGPILHDWLENPFVKGPLSAPVVADGRVYVTRPDAHEVLAVDAGAGTVRWQFIADGRVDTPPAIHRGLCLFGTHGGSVYALRADSGELVWRLRVAPRGEQIVADGQLE